MFKTIIFIILFSLHSFVSHASPNDKGLICKSSLKQISKLRNNKGYFFENGRVIEFSFIKKNRKIIIQKDELSSFNLTIDTISWFKEMLIYKLNRKNLVLTTEISNITLEYNCELINKITLFKKLDSFKKIFQNEIDKKLKENKI